MRITLPVLADFEFTVHVILRSISLCKSLLPLAKKQLRGNGETTAHTLHGSQQLYAIRR